MGGGAGYRTITPDYTKIRAEIEAPLDRGELTPSWAALHDDPIVLLDVVKSWPSLFWDEAKMRRVQVPVLAVVGSNDRFLASAQDLKTVLPSVKLVVIAGATHAGAAGALYRPEVIAAIQHFLSEHRAASAR
jgi:pimeloyl-ACP methyl ester carboxylesterase